MKFTIKVHSRAYSDARTIFRWLRRKSPAGATAWFESYLAKLDLLSEIADSSSNAPEAASLKIDLRQSLFKTRRGHNYRLLFSFDGETVNILRVRAPGQRPVRRRDLPSD